MDFDRQTLYQHNVSDEAVDFIGRLLEKDPAKRMTLTEALTHEWLAGPSSLPVETSQALGGDSMWNIQSFNSAASDWRSPSPGGMDIEDGERTPWNRPMTMSGTNFDSEHSSAGDSFSQPMEKLRLNTAAGVAMDLPVTKEETESPGPSRSPTPAPESVDVDAPLEEAVAAEPNGNSAGLLTTNTLKRSLSVFSSGSLSPAPDSQPKPRDTTPQAPKPKSPVKRPLRGSTARLPASSVAARTRSRAPELVKAEDKPSSRSIRPRKSMRQV